MKLNKTSELKESENKKISKEIIAWMKGAMGSTIAINRDKWIAWLKKQGEQNQWEPSEKQIVALRWVLNHIPYDTHKEEIRGLLEQLLKLSNLRT